MKKEKIQIDSIPAILYGNQSEKIYLYVHGKHSSKEEAESFAEIANSSGYQVLSFDLPEHGDRINTGYPCTVQNGTYDLKTVYSYLKDKYKHISLFACSLGAYFCQTAFQNTVFEKCLFLSPILDMEKLIRNMMEWSNVTEKQLQEKKEISTSFGETLSWNYYEYVKNHPIIKWESDTWILYGENDNLTERSVLEYFSEKYNCNTDIMKNGDHFFHTEEQLIYLKKWIREVIV